VSSLPPLAEADYIALAEPELARLLAALDQLGEGLEAELASDIITIEFSDGSRFVLNSHRAARQIWMAAGTHAWHFDFVREQSRWVALKNGDELWSCLERVLSEKLGRRVTLME
jgi:CyaY protein